MKKNRLLLSAAASLVFASCATQTPQDRIQANPGRFTGLPARHQELVRQGQIDRGMSQDAVWLAWGRPDRVYEGTAEGVATARWDYAGLQAVSTIGFYGGYGYGHGYPGAYPYGRGRYGYPYYGITPQVNYVPYRSATVFFKRGKVDSWERAR